MGPPVDGSGMGGLGHPYVREFLHVGVSGGPTLNIRGIGDFSTHWEDTRRIYPPGDTPTDRVTDEAAGG